MPSRIAEVIVWKETTDVYRLQMAIPHFSTK